MDLLRDRAERHPKSFNIPGRLILNTEFIRAVDIEYRSFQAMGSEYTVPEYMMEWVAGIYDGMGRRDVAECRWEAMGWLYAYVRTSMSESSLHCSGNRIRRLHDVCVRPRSFMPDTRPARAKSRVAVCDRSHDG
ncbi:uncharacterized protein LOC111368382 [Olea europaea var. sylvestris]|uniref:uncharacterized protein LOC111368382 n=1 Tax=Olea europaea var. sylvestris TaxID=158386 RepID=UPI000C1CED73|nr:uncharacterized protein LOC111368382 [Olea europaea var. sylvestris]